MDRGAPDVGAALGRAALHAAPRSGPLAGTLPIPVAIARGLRGRCPRCGEGALFAGFITLAERCAVCGLDFAAADTGDGPAVFLIFGLGFLIVPLALLVDRLFAPPLLVHAVLWGAALLALTLGGLRPAKGVLFALQVRNAAGQAGP